MQRFLGLMLCVLGIAVLAGCAKPAYKNWAAMDGSRNDGTVKLAFTWDPQREKPESSTYQADDLAAQRCAAWGYAGAQPFGGSNQQCVQWSGNLCVRMQVERVYQCVGSKPRPAYRQAPRPDTPYSRTEG